MAHPVTKRPHPNLRDDERGEIASWLILGAALALIAALLSPILQPTFTELANRIGQPSDGFGGNELQVDTSPVAADGPGVGSPTPADFVPVLVSPSDEATEALGEVVELVDKGGDLGLSEDELDDVHDHLASLAPEELNYVLSNLSDEQLERIFHNAFSSCFFCDDWNDGERRDFFDNLLRADSTQRNQIAASLTDATHISEGDYLEILLGLQVDVSNGSKPNGAEIDLWIQAVIDADFLEGPLEDGLTGAGRVIIVDDDAYERAWRYEIRDRSEDGKAAAALVFENSRGFVDADGRLWVQDSKSNTPGTAVHEVVHGYSRDELRDRAVALNEGVTEYFTREVLATIDDPTTSEDEAQQAIDERGYTRNYRFARALANVVGDEAVAAAYFDGDIDALADAYIATTNRTREDFDAMLDLVKPRNTDDPATAEDENRQRWDDAADYLTVVPAP